jgi:hypothetical protein
MNMRYFYLSLMLVLSGCAYPSSHEEQGAAPGLLYFPGAQRDARVSIDGKDAGTVASFDGDKQALSVMPGTHRVIVSLDRQILLDKKYYVDAGARVAVQ